jgi:hypothetical protein
MALAFPTFGSAFINDVLDALRKRQKAIKYKVRDIGCEKVIERQEADREKLEITIHTSERAAIRLFIWDDRWAWVDCRLGTKDGWAWQWTTDGRVMGSIDGQIMVSSLEQSIDAAAAVGSNGTSTFADVWSTKLARGPRLVSR